MRSRLVAGLSAFLLTSVLVACDAVGGSSGEDGRDAEGSSSAGGDTSRPERGSCRMIDVEVVEAASDDTDPVECTAEHNAETFHVGELSGAEGLGYDDASVAAQVYRQCQPRFMRFVGATESLALRSVVDWAWWRPSEQEWEEGARWFRCDVVGGREGSAQLVGLPETAKGMLLGIPPPRWMLCADGPQVADAPKVPCSQPHTWRAVSAVVLGKPKDTWPGARVVEVNTRDYCSDWVGAWLNYPVDYEYGYTWFGAAEWRAGNRQSVCWARADG